ncbi:CRAL-TRIO domain-containing protein [Fomitopsis serialis]|uniref:CRAL-TRIO domain-containing protein n=1 Tax=Fomitopsis serialis TaxID=139415 RepID=UPI002007C333|nr:CRAL-TRIO domain-containing protein [Neoantrodia serialis]KAH9920156.1 CRAL-TRIO domain-containing protein [Neoantrodia serialis]
MKVYDGLRCEKEKLDELYRKELNTVLDLHDLLLDHVIPDMVAELGVDERGRQNFVDWAADIPSIFRVLKRHKFVASLALEDIRRIMLGRLSPISRPRTDVAQFLRCLPLSSVDSFGRPIIVIRPKGLQLSSPELPSILNTSMESLRVRLHQLNSKCDVREPPVLQYIALLDMEGVSITSAGRMDVISKFAQQILPAFPGMIAAVFVLNYAWSFSGAWNFAKHVRLLPPRARSRIFFPSREELLDYLPPECLPSDFGGLLPPSSELEDPLRTSLKTADGIGPQCHADADAGPARKSVDTLSDSEAADPEIPMMGVPPSRPAPQHSPYYGYPILHDTPIPTLRHGRRRKRDLLRTLAWLFWARWHIHLVTALAAVVLVAVVRISRRTRFAFSMRAQTSSLTTMLRGLLGTGPGVR